MTSLKRKNLKILIIDDNIQFTKNLKNLIENVGNGNLEKIDIVHTGMNGLNKLNNDYYDFVFVDIGLPDINGIDVVSAYDWEFFRRKTKIIAISFHNEFEFVKDMLSAGAFKYLNKGKISYESIEAILNQ